MKHFLYPALAGQQLGVHLVGAGGNGSQMLTGLARIHVALQAVGHPGLKVEVYDPDTITDANVGRQLFSPSDVGQFKAAVLIHRINCYYGLDWKANTSMATFNSHVDIVIGCVDSVASRRKIHQSGSFHYWLDVGNLARTVQVILGAQLRKDNKFDETRPKTFFEFFPELNRGKIKENNEPSCSLAEALEKQDLFINQTVVTFGLQLLWTFLRNGCLTQNGYFINLESGRVVPIPLARQNLLTPLVDIFANETKKKAKR